jgi:hypothetical protein
MRFKIIILLFTSLLLVNCSKEDAPKLNSENKIISFKLTSVKGQIYIGQIDHSTKSISLNTNGLEFETSLTPTIEISSNASIDPQSNIPKDFNTDIKYTVTAQNGDKATYTIVTNNTPFSDEKKILSFKFNIDNEIFNATIDENNLSINLTTYKDVSNISPEITFSNYATISLNPSIKQDFNFPVDYTVTAQNGTTTVYKVKVTKIEITNTYNKCYIRATSFGTINNIDLTNSNYKLYLENKTNSYLLNYFDVVKWDSNGTMNSNFYFYFDEKIATASDYKLVIKLNNKVEAQTSYPIDVLAENAPKILTSNKTNYNYTDNLIISGTNLLPGLEIPANNGLYRFNENYLNLNPEKTILTFTMDVYQLFPSYLGQQSPRSSRVAFFYNDRHGDSIILNFH